MLSVREIEYKRGAIRDLRRIPETARDRIRDKIEQYADDPASLASNVTQLVDRPGKRLRVGDYRVVFEEDETVVTILLVRTRDESTYGR